MISTLYCVHGWSFDRHFWEGIRPFLPGMSLICSDSGYFGSPFAPPLPEEPYLAVGHSAGVLSLLGRELPGCAGIVSFNGFARFVEGQDFPEGTPTRFLERMRVKVRRAPDTVLTDFRTTCGTAEPWPATPDSQRLSDGLIPLLTEDRRTEAERWGNRLHWLAGMNDPFGAARAMHSASGGMIEGGHLLPLNQPERCAAFIQRALHATH